MPTDLDQLVRDAASVTGATMPRLMEADAPTLVADRAVPSPPDDARDVYFVGLIGGKEVGKSAMVNALAGRPITAVTSFGAGTEGVVAYVHASRAEATKELLEREAAGQYRIVVHNLADTDPARVLLDLPDIDSHFESHLALTRRMLRQMLFPVWLASIEKYADQQPREMLRRVAEGNDPDNFVFVLNKADQLGDDIATAREIATDYGQRVAAAVGLDAPPRVWVVSATRPQAYDLLALRDALTRSRSRRDVEAARQLAVRRRDASLVAWLDEQDLPAPADRLRRVATDMQDLLADRLAAPLLERAVPRLTADVAYRAALVDAAMAARVARWPLVNLVHTLLGPLLAATTALVRGGTSAATGMAGGLVDAYAMNLDGRPLHTVVATTFAHLRQTSPAVATLYTTQKPWKDRAAELASLRLRSRLVETVERQRGAVVQRYATSRNPLAAIVRWTLTIGALLWFPFVQPVLEIAMQPGFSRTTQELLALVVKVLGATYLLTTVSFLLVWFIVLWLALRWSTARAVARQLTSWARGGADGTLDLTRQAAMWVDELGEPVQGELERVERLAREVDAARKGLR
jgi:hypothetical protein